MISVNLLKENELLEVDDVITLRSYNTETGVSKKPLSGVWNGEKKELTLCIHGSVTPVEDTKWIKIYDTKDEEFLRIESSENINLVNINLFTITLGTGKGRIEFENESENKKFLEDFGTALGDNLYIPYDNPESHLALKKSAYRYYRIEGVSSPEMNLGFKHLDPCTGEVKDQYILRTYSNLEITCEGAEDDVRLGLPIEGGVIDIQGTAEYTDYLIIDGKIENIVGTGILSISEIPSFRISEVSNNGFRYKTHGTRLEYLFPENGIKRPVLVIRGTVMYENINGDPITVSSDIMTLYQTKAVSMWEIRNSTTDLYNSSGMTYNEASSYVKDGLRVYIFQWDSYSNNDTHSFDICINLQPKTPKITYSIDSRYGSSKSAEDIFNEWFKVECGEWEDPEGQRHFELPVTITARKNWTGDTKPYWAPYYNDRGLLVKVSIEIEDIGTESFYVIMSPNPNVTYSSTWYAKDNKFYTSNPTTITADLSETVQLGNVSEYYVNIADTATWKYSYWRVLSASGDTDYSVKNDYYSGYAWGSIPGTQPPFTEGEKINLLHLSWGNETGIKDYKIILGLYTGEQETNHVEYYHHETYSCTHWDLIGSTPTQRITIQKRFENSIVEVKSYDSSYMNYRRSSIRTSSGRFDFGEIGLRHITFSTNTNFILSAEVASDIDTTYDGNDFQYMKDRIEFVYIDPVTGAESSEVTLTEEEKSGLSPENPTVDKVVTVRFKYNLSARFPKSDYWDESPEVYYKKFGWLYIKTELSGTWNTFKKYDLWWKWIKPDYRIDSGDGFMRNYGASFSRGTDFTGYTRGGVISYVTARNNHNDEIRFYSNVTPKIIYVDESPSGYPSGNFVRGVLRIEDLKSSDRSLYSYSNYSVNYGSVYPNSSVTEAIQEFKDTFPKIVAGLGPIPITAVGSIRFLVMWNGDDSEHPTSTSFIPNYFYIAPKPIVFMINNEVRTYSQTGKIVAYLGYAYGYPGGGTGIWAEYGKSDFEVLESMVDDQTGGIELVNSVRYNGTTNDINPEFTVSSEDRNYYAKVSYDLHGIKKGGVNKLTTDHNTEFLSQDQLDDLTGSASGIFYVYPPKRTLDIYTNDYGGNYTILSPGEFTYTVQPKVALNGDETWFTYGWRYPMTETGTVVGFSDYTYENFQLQCNTPPHQDIFSVGPATIVTPFGQISGDYGLGPLDPDSEVLDTFKYEYDDPDSKGSAKAVIAAALNYTYCPSHYAGDTPMTETGVGVYRIPHIYDSLQVTSSSILIPTGVYLGNIDTTTGRNVATVNVPATDYRCSITVSNLLLDQGYRKTTPMYPYMTSDYEGTIIQRPTGNNFVVSFGLNTTTQERVINLLIKSYYQESLGYGSELLIKIVQAPGENIKDRYKFLSTGHLYDTANDDIIQELSINVDPVDFPGTEAIVDLDGSSLRNSISTVGSVATLTIYDMKVEENMSASSKNHILTIQGSSDEPIIINLEQGYFSVGIVEGTSLDNGTFNILSSDDYYFDTREVDARSSNEDRLVYLIGFKWNDAKGSREGVFSDLSLWEVSHSWWSMTPEDSLYNYETIVIKDDTTYEDPGIENIYTSKEDFISQNIDFYVNTWLSIKWPYLIDGSVLSVNKNLNFSYIKKNG